MPLVTLTSRTYMWHLARVRKDVASVVAHRRGDCATWGVGAFTSLCGMVQAVPDGPASRALADCWVTKGPGWCWACGRILRRMKERGEKL